MRILDQNGVELTQPDLDAGYLAEDKIFVKHHDAVAAQKEVGHHVTLRTYPNGGKDVEWVVDVPAVKAQPEWDEYEDIQRYIPYTKEELDEMNRPHEPTPEERISALEALTDDIVLFMAELIGG